MVGYNRQRTEEDHRLAPTPSRAWDVIEVLFWTLLAGIVLWNAPFLAWIGILKLAGLMIGFAMLFGAASVVTRRAQPRAVSNPAPRGPGA